MIIVNARFLMQSITGVQRYAIELCKRLPDRIGEKKIVFVAPKGYLQTELKEFDSVKRIGTHKGQLWEQIDLPVFLRNKGNPLLINMVGIGPLFYKNKITALYDLAFKHHPEWFSFKFRTAYNFAIPRSIRKARRIITDSNYVRQDIASTYDLPAHLINVIYAAPSEKFRHLELAKEKIILTVSSIDPRKNLNRVIEAFSKMNTSYTLVIVGAKHKAFAKVFMGQGGRQKNIIFAGYLDDQELIDLYNKASIFVYASLFEGFGIPPLEAQACGCPCLVSNTTALPEVYGDSVQYCDPHSVESIREGLEGLTNDENLRNALIEKGFANIKKYSWQSSASQFLKLIEREVNEKSSGT